MSHAHGKSSAACAIQWLQADDDRLQLLLSSTQQYAEVLLDLGWYGTSWRDVVQQCRDLLVDLADLVAQQAWRARSEQRARRPSDVPAGERGHSVVGAGRARVYRTVRHGHLRLRAASFQRLLRVEGGMPSFFAACDCGMLRYSVMSAYCVLPSVTEGTMLSCCELPPVPPPPLPLLLLESPPSDSPLPLGVAGVRGVEGVGGGDMCGRVADDTDGADDEVAMAPEEAAAVAVAMAVLVLVLAATSDEPGGAGTTVTSSGIESSPRVGVLLLATPLPPRLCVSDSCNELGRGAVELK